MRDHQSGRRGVRPAEEAAPDDPPPRPLTTGQAAGYLAGIIDGEGTVVCDIQPGRHANRWISVTNTDPGIITATQHAFAVLGIEAWTHERKPASRMDQGYRTAWEVRVTRRANLERALKLIPLQAPGKAARLRRAVETYQQRHRRPNEIPAEELRRRYHDEEASVAELAAHFAVTEGTILRWMDASGLARRSRQENARLMWKRRRLPPT